MNFTKVTAEPSFIFEISGVSISPSVANFSAAESISRPYSVILTVSTEKEIERIETVAGKEAVLTVVANEPGTENRYFHGIIREFELSGRRGNYFIYHTEVVPRLWSLSLRKNCRIFQDMNVQDIVKHIIEEHGITSELYRFAIRNKQRKRGYCVQYRESDLDFVNRLLQEEGIFYFFQHLKNRHLLIISDDQAVHTPVKREKKITFNSGGMLGEKECVNVFSFSHRLHPQAFSHRNFNFKKPSLDLTSKKSATNSTQLEIYDYPALHTTEDRGDQLAKIRMEELILQQQLGYGESSCAQLMPGHTFTLTNHDSQVLNIDYLILSVSHAGVQPQSLQEVSEGGFFYDARFYAIPASFPYRPPITVSKPSIPGLQTAIVVGPPGQEIHTDEYGRIKVRFHWDREAGKDGNSSCWLRINQPWSGSRWGMIAIPRVGDEVLVAFLDGDPDRPIMVGNVNNADSPALYPLPANQTRVGIRTQSTPNGTHENFNELRFEDKKGSEHIYLQSERDWNILIKNDKDQAIGHDEILRVKNNRTKTVGVDQIETIGANMSVEVGANKNERVDINSAETIGAAKELTVGGLYQVTVGGAMNETVAGAKAEEVGIGKSVLVGAHMTEDVKGTRTIAINKDFATTVGRSSVLKAKSIMFQADDEIVFSIGNSRISMSNNGEIIISGGNIQVKGTGEIVIKGAKISEN